MILAEALPHNASLKTLDLRWNGAGDEGARHLEGALTANHTLLRLPLQGAPSLAAVETRPALSTQTRAFHPDPRSRPAFIRSCAGNRVSDAQNHRITNLLARNGAVASGTTNYLALSAPPEDELGAGAPRGMAERSLVVRTKALEGALTLQQEEFTNKLSHVQTATQAAEARANEECGRADALVVKLAATEARAAEAAKSQALAEQALEEGAKTAAAEVELARSLQRNAEHAARQADAAREAYARQVAVQHESLAAQVQAVEEREARAAAAESRSLEAHQQLAAAHETMASERRAHAAALGALQRRLTDSEELAHRAEARLAEAAGEAAAAQVTARQAHAHAIRLPHAPPHIMIRVRSAHVPSLNHARHLPPAARWRL